jgi:hypothetical protein
MTSRSRQPDRNGLADIADGSHRQRRVESQVPSLSAPARSDRMGAIDGVRKESAVPLTGGRNKSLPGVRIRTWSVAAATLVALAGAGCSNDGEALPGTTTTTRSQTTTTTTTTTTEPERPVEEEVVERYEAFWEARFEANTEPVNPDHPGLREYATGAQRENVIEETERNAREGRAFRRPENSQDRRSVEVLRIDDHTAVLQDCVVNDGIVYRVDTSEVLDDSVVTHNVEATMVRVDGQWKLEQARLVQRWEGVAGCALADES